MGTAPSQSRLPIRVHPSLSESTVHPSVKLRPCRAGPLRALTRVPVTAVGLSRLCASGQFRLGRAESADQAMAWPADLIAGPDGFLACARCPSQARSGLQDYAAAQPWRPLPDSNLAVRDRAAAPALEAATSATARLSPREGDRRPLDGPRSLVAVPMSSLLGAAGRRSQTRRQSVGAVESRPPPTLVRILELSLNTRGESRYRPNTSVEHVFGVCNLLAHTHRAACPGPHRNSDTGVPGRAPAHYECW